MIHVTPYLLFDGTCKSAMEFYQACFGGELTLTVAGESVLKDQLPPSLHGKVLNARLKSPAVEISASDWMRPDRTPIQGNTVCLYLNGGTPDELAAFFARLSVGAQITDPLQDLPVGTYGALNDPFGVRWMFHAERLRPNIG